MIPLTTFRTLCGPVLVGWEVHAENAEPLGSRKGTVKRLFMSGRMIYLDGGWDYMPSFSIGPDCGVTKTKNRVEIWGPPMGGIHWTFRR